MTSATSLRIFNLYDILGVMVPGITLFTGALLFLPDPPAPSELWEYLLYGIVIFSVGYFVQFWASKAVGELKTFERTMDDVRNPVEVSESDNSESAKTENASEESNGSSVELDEEENEEIETSNETLDFNSESTGVIGHFIYALLGPVIWRYWSPTDRSIGSELHANRVWKDVRDTYNLERDTDDYEELQQMIQSEVDDVRSPSRSYRFQAIRNFHRGMWVSLWIVSILFLGYFLNEWCLGLEISIIHGTEQGEPYILQQEWWSFVAPLIVVSLIVFWRLHVEFQREFVRYLIIDYFVKLRARGEADLERD